MAKGLGGFQPDTKSPSSRRADFDLQRRIALIEHNGGGNGDGDPGPPGPPGQGVPVGGTPGQVLAKTSNVDYETAWVPQTGGGGTDEVWIGTSAPVDPALELWYNPAASGNGGGGTGADEVWIGDAAPTDEAIELWFDTDAVPAVSSATTIVAVPYDDWPPVDPQANVLYLRLAP